MAATVTLNTTAFLLDAARDAYSVLRRAKGQRPQAVQAFLDATDDDQRDAAVAEWGAGFVRRGLREAAVFYARKGDDETANTFWALRDSIDDDGFMTFDDDSVVVEEALAS